MTFLSDTLRINSNRIYDFGTTGEVHQINYYHQPATIAHFRKILGL